MTDSRQGSEVEKLIKVVSNKSNSSDGMDRCEW